MTITGDHRAETAPTSRPGPRPAAGAAGAGAATLAAIVVGMIVSAVYRQGGFYPSDAFGLAVISLPLVALALARHRDRHAIALTVAVGSLAAWWLVRTQMEHSLAAFLPLGASLLAFLAAFLVVRLLADRDRSRVAAALVAIGALSAVAGLTGVLWRWHPLSYQAAGSWRVSTTLTYPGAASVLFILALLLGLSLDVRTPLPRAAVALCAAGLIGTQSHWELLALAGGMLLVPPRRWLDACWPLALGSAAGVLVVLTSSGRRPGWEWVAAVAAGLAASALPPPRRLAAPLLTGLGAVVLAGCVAVLVAHSASGHGPQQPADRSQIVSWSSSTVALQSSLVDGVGPPRLFATHDPVVSYPGFFPDGYLTVTAEGGLLGAVLLLGTGGLVAVAIRRRDLVSSCAAAATVAFAVAGGIDYDWQLPALALLGGCVAGLAAPAWAPVREPTAPAAHGPRAARRAAVVVIWTLAAVMVVGAQLVIGASQEASGTPGVRNAAPPPSTTPASPGRIILTGPDPTDPFMLKYHGDYYLYTSEGQSLKNVPLRIGSQLGQWSKAVNVLPRLPAWAAHGADWAPDVQQVAGGWALYFTALVKGASPPIHCIGSAFAATPAGPFVPAAGPFICQPAHRGSIDARVFVAPGHQLVMLWKSDDNADPRVPGPDQGGDTGIYSQYLSADGRQLLGQPVKILSPSEPWEINIIEAPDMVEAWGTYWLFFSGNWYYSPSYGIGVAACQSPVGPCTDPDPAPFLGSNLQGAGPGEASVFRDGSNLYLVYNPFRANDPGPVIPRPVAMTRIGFTPKGPYLAAP